MTDKNGFAPLHSAVSECNLDTADLLIRQRSKINVQTKKVHTLAFHRH